MYQYILASLLIAGQLTGYSAPDQTEALISRIPDEPIPYTSYAGPILPLEVQTEGLAADRSVSLDLSLSLIHIYIGSHNNKPPGSCRAACRYIGFTMQGYPAITVSSFANSQRVMV